MKVYITTTMRSPCAFASEEWQTVPFLLESKLPIDELVDILLYLPHCLAIETQLKALHADSDGHIRQRLKTKLSGLLKQPIDSLSAWWMKHNHSHMKKHDDTATSSTTAKADLAYTEAFTSPLAATSVAYFHSAQAIITSLSDLVESSKQSCELLVHDMSVIISAAEYHRARGNYSGGTFMMIYPIKVGLFRSPCPNQREELTKVLLDWGRERGVEGVCSSGAPLWHQPDRFSTLKVQSI
jgi:hypothetical protein